MKTNTLKHSFTITTATQRTKVKITLADDCRNGHEDFSITADVDEKDARGIWREYMGGCCHDHILSLRPDLKPFVDLHLSTWQGVPMHAVSNAWYWFAGIFPDNFGEKYSGATGSSGKSADECRRIFAEHLRITPQEVQALIDSCPRTKEELQALLEDMSLPARWQSEAAAAIRQLEAWTGNTFESKATRGFWEPLPQDVREAIKARRASGYYSPEQVAARDADAKQERINKALAELETERDGKIQQAQEKFAAFSWLASRAFQLDNWIYYSHTRSFCFGWKNPVKPHELAAFLEVASEFPAAYEVKCSDGRTLNN